MPKEEFKATHIFKELEGTIIMLQRDYSFHKNDVTYTPNPYWENAMAVLEQAMAQIGVICHQEILSHHFEEQINILAAAMERGGYRGPKPGN